jgi:hypothetical protein
MPEEVETFAFQAEIAQLVSSVLEISCSVFPGFPQRTHLPNHVPFAS